MYFWRLAEIKDPNKENLFHENFEQSIIIN